MKQGVFLSLLESKPSKDTNNITKYKQLDTSQYLALLRLQCMHRLHLCGSTARSSKGWRLDKV